MLKPKRHCSKQLASSIQAASFGIVMQQIASGNSFLDEFTIIAIIISPTIPSFAIIRVPAVSCATAHAG